MIWDVLAPMVVFVTLIVTTGAVILLRPLSRNLGALLQAMTQERRNLTSDEELQRLRETVAALENRLAGVEERQSFAEALLSSGPRATLAHPRSPTDA